MIHYGPLLQICNVLKQKNSLLLSQPFIYVNHSSLRSRNITFSFYAMVRSKCNICDPYLKYVEIFQQSWFSMEAAICNQIRVTSSGYRWTSCCIFTTVGCRDNFILPVILDLYFYIIKSLIDLLLHFCNIGLERVGEEWVAAGQ